MTAPKLSRHSENGRMYDWADETYVSVTNVISVLDKPFMAAGARKIVAEIAIDTLPKYLALAWTDRTYAKKILKADARAVWDERTRIGTGVHAAVEAWCKGVPEEVERIVPMAPEIVPYFDQWLAFVVDRKPVQVVHSEVSVFNRLHHYAGTIDLVCLIDGECWLIDIKTGAAVWPDSCALQLCALKWAEFMVLDDAETPMPHVHRSAVLHLQPNGYRLVEMKTDMDVFLAFIAVKGAWHWKHEASEQVIVEQPQP